MAFASASGAGKTRLELPASCQPPQSPFPERKLVWIIFGGTGHVGRSLVRSAIAHGDNVLMVGKTGEMSAAVMQKLALEIRRTAEAMIADAAQSEPDAWKDGGKIKVGSIQWAQCDVRFRKTVDDVVARALKVFGRIDVVANCSGYGVVGSCEDQDELEVRDQFQTNFTGTLNILQATLPIFRRQRREAIEAAEAEAAEAEDADETEGESGSDVEMGNDKDDKDDKETDELPNGGRYLIFSSTSGALGVPGLGPYCATKYAVEGLIEAMLYEVDTFDIKATLVEPGLVRRDDPRGVQAVDRSLSGMPEYSENSGDPDYSDSPERHETAQGLPPWGHFLINKPSAPYASASSPSLHAMRMVKWLGDRQPTGVVQCAEICWMLAHCKFPPVRLPLGSYAIESIRDRLRSVTEELEDWRHLHFAPAGAAGAAGAAAADDEDMA